MQSFLTLSNGSLLRGGILKNALGKSLSVLSTRALASFWSPEKEPNHKFKSAYDIIRRDEIYAAVERTQAAARDEKKVEAILAKAMDHATLKHLDGAAPGAGDFVCGLSLEDTATLLNVDSKDQKLMKKLYDTAFAIKKRIYGNRIVLFAPLYIANYCTNDCTYCGFRRSNTEIERSTLNTEQIIANVQALQRQGHRRLLLLTGESPEYSFDELLKAIKTVSEVETFPHGKIRRINVEIPALSVSDFRRLKATGCVGTYTLFQETYDSELYPKYHISGPKSDYANRVTVFDRAMTAKVDDVGLGVLFGLADYRFEVCALLQHAQHLMATYNAGPHTISIPRIRPAAGAPTSNDVPYPVDDADFLKLVAVIRCAVPYTGMILSTRENKAIRDKLLHMGISQMSAGSKTDVGSYTEKEHHEKEKGQFSINDERSLDEIVADLLDSGFIPSWCTACYRCGRTGEQFMEIAKRGDIHEYCHPNALLTLKEFSQDYASAETQSKANALIEREAKTIQQKSLPGKLAKIDEGERDLYF